MNALRASVSAGLSPTNCPAGVLVSTGIGSCEPGTGAGREMVETPPAVVADGACAGGAGMALGVAPPPISVKVGACVGACAPGPATVGAGGAGAGAGTLGGADPPGGVTPAARAAALAASTEVGTGAGAGWVAALGWKLPGGRPSCMTFS